MAIESVKWYQSDVLRAAIGGLVASFVAVIVAVLALFGVTLDPAFQGQIIAALMAIFALVTMAFHVWSIFGRLNTNTVIAGSSGEKKIIEASGVMPIPKASTLQEPVKTINQDQSQSLDVKGEIANQPEKA